jgi:hypothetical protein
MPPRHAYWTIIVDNQPTSFRAHDVEELLPTFNRLREKHPSAQLKWFERGRLWESRDAAREHGLGKGERRWTGGRPSDDAESGPPRDARWRPGGEHRDPRQKYKDAKKAKWQRYKQQIRARWEEKVRARTDVGDFTPPHGDPMRSKIAAREEPRHERRGDRRWNRPDSRTVRAPADRSKGGKGRDAHTGRHPGDDRRGRDQRPHRDRDAHSQHAPKNRRDGTFDRNRRDEDRKRRQGSSSYQDESRKSSGHRDRSRGRTGWSGSGKTGAKKPYGSSRSTGGRGPGKRREDEE